MPNRSLQNRHENGPGFQRISEPDREAMLAALRVVLGLPRVIPNSGDDLLSDAS